MTATSPPSIFTATVVLHVEDIFETIEFYRLVFGFEQSDQADENRAVLRFGSFVLCLIDASAVRRLEIDDVHAPPAGLPQGSELVFTIRASEIDGLLRNAINAGAVPVRTASETDDIFLRDPNGFLIRLMDRPSVE